MTKPRTTYTYDDLTEDVRKRYEEIDKAVGDLRDAAGRLYPYCSEQEQQCIGLGITSADAAFGREAANILHSLRIRRAP